MNNYTLTSWPIQKIGILDMNLLMSEVGDIPKPEGPRQFPFQYKGEGYDINESKSTGFTLRTDEFDFNVPIYPKEYPYLNSIMEKYQMHRTRKMWLHEKFNYAWHVDNSPRIHIPLVTNKHCMWIIRDKDGLNDRVYRIPADGGVYLVDTTVDHTFMNANAEPFLRSHIVGSTTLNMN